jgi:predicted nucleic acid-binding protein
MSLYVDSSALLKRYVDEPDSEECEAILRSDPSLVTGRHTLVEVRRNLARLLEFSDLRAAKSAFERDWAAISVVELDRTTCETAASVGEVTGARTLDVLHLACAQRVGGTALPFVTYDVRQAHAARSVGFTVLGT